MRRLTLYIYKLDGSEGYLINPKDNSLKMTRQYREA